jgi:peptidoglycan/xylan/chitin deacetylase (PgdA/CDA1 family)
VPATVFVTSDFVGSDRELWSDELERILLQPSTLPAVLDLALDDFELRWELAEDAIYDSHAALRHREWRASSGTAPTARHALYLQLWELLRHARPEVRDTVMDRIADWAGAEQVLRSTHRALTLDELRTLGMHDLIEIGAHSVTHSSLAALAPERQREEIMVSKRFLEEATNGEVRAFAYPYGAAADYTSATIEMLREAAFDCACANFGGAVVASTDVFQLPRLVAPALPGGDFARYLGAALRLPLTRTRSMHTSLRDV